MRIVVLIKPVPDVAAGAERLRPDGQLDRAAAPSVINGNDEFALEGALRLIAVAGGEVVVVVMCAADGEDTIRRALAMGADRAIHLFDPALEGSDTLATARTLAAGVAPLEADLVLAGIDTSDGAGGVVGAGVATLLGLPYLPGAAAIDLHPAGGSIRVRRATPTGHEVLEASLPAVVTCTQVLGDPRYPSLKGIMAARSKPIERRSLTDVGMDAAMVGRSGATTRVVQWRQPGPRPPARVVKGPPSDVASELVSFLADRGLA
jgi:electron transfer flavoprotein beta subunit